MPDRPSTRASERLSTAASTLPGRVTVGALDRPRISEVTVRELTRTTSRMVAAAAAGERLIVTRNGQPVAVLLGIDDAVDWLVTSADEFVRLRMAAREELDRADGSGGREGLDGLDGP